MEEKQLLNHDFCVKYRKEIKAYGLKQAVRDLLSTTNKVDLKKKFLAREAEKRESFRNELISVCNSIICDDRKLMPVIRSLQKEIII